MFSRKFQPDLNGSVWYKARDLVLARMSELAGKPIERFTPHDFRRTVRSNTKRLHVVFETAESVLNHLKRASSGPMTATTSKRKSVPSS